MFGLFFVSSTKKDHAVDAKYLAPSTMAITNTHHVKTDKEMLQI